MNLKGQKVAGYALLAIVIAFATSVDRFASHSLLSNTGVVALQATFTLLIVLGIDQTVYKSSKSFRKMDDEK